MTNTTETKKMTNEQKALGEAVAAIYFDDSSDFGSALWKIVGLLGGEEAVNLLEEDDHEAFMKYADGRRN